MANMCDCAKSDRCKNAKNCRYEFEPLANYLCFNSQRYDNTVIKRKKHERPKIKIKDHMSITDQIYIALTDSIDDEAASEREIAAATGVDTRTIHRYLRGATPVGLESLEAILYAVGFRLEVVPIDKGGCSND